MHCGATILCTHSRVITHCDITTDITSNIITHCDITMGNGIAGDAHCDVTMNDHCDVTLIDIHVPD